MQLQLLHQQLTLPRFLQEQFLDGMTHAVWMEKMSLDYKRTFEKLTVALQAPPPATPTVATLRAPLLSIESRPAIDETTDAVVLPSSINDRIAPAEAVAAIRCSYGQPMRCSYGQSCRGADVPPGLCQSCDGGTVHHMCFVETFPDLAEDQSRLCRNCAVEQLGNGDGDGDGHNFDGSHSANTGAEGDASVGEDVNNAVETEDIVPWRIRRSIRTWSKNDDIDAMSV